MIENLILAGALASAAVLAALYLHLQWKIAAASKVERSFAGYTDAVPAGLWRTNREGQFIYANAAWRQMVGMREGDSLDQTWSPAIHAADRKRVIDSWNSAIAARQPFREEVRWVHADGTCLWVLCQGVPEFGPHGDFLGYVGTNIEIQRRKQLEEDLATALEQSENAAAAKSIFLANMSHEIRTPMNGVIGFTELLLNSDLTETQQSQVQLIADSGKAMMRLLNDILDVAKIESGQLRINKEATDLRQKIGRCVNLLEPIARTKGLRLSSFLADEVPDLVEMDRLRVRQILLNLIGNAVKFTESGGVDVEVRVEGDGEDRLVAISVLDTGIGIERDKLESIFIPFTQEDGSTSRRHGGTGLGLTISSQLVEMMGGTIAVESQPGVGTSFTVRLPLREAAARPGGDSETAEEAAQDVSLQGLRVLIAEDHSINQELTMAMARSLGLDARLAANGKEAVAAVVEADESGAPFQAVLMDMLMPEMDGLEATRRIRSLGYPSSDLPIIALTANCYPDDIAACRRAGMQAHLGKPLKAAELGRELSRLISRNNALSKHENSAQSRIVAQDPSAEG